MRMLSLTRFELRAFDVVDCPNVDTLLWHVSYSGRPRRISKKSKVKNLDGSERRWSQVAVIGYERSDCYHQEVINILAWISSTDGTKGRQWYPSWPTVCKTGCARTPLTRKQGGAGVCTRLLQTPTPPPPPPPVAEPFASGFRITYRLRHARDCMAKCFWENPLCGRGDAQSGVKGKKARNSAISGESFIGGDSVIIMTDCIGQ